MPLGLHTTLIGMLELLRLNLCAGACGLLVKSRVVCPFDRGCNLKVPGASTAGMALHSCGFAVLDIRKVRWLPP
jgi:hypothetical protein